MDSALFVMSKQSVNFIKRSNRKKIDFQARDFEFVGKVWVWNVKQKYKFQLRHF